MNDARPIDFESFERDLVNALRAAWTEVRSERPNESFYLFGIETDADAIVLTPYCNTHEQYEKEGDPSNGEIAKWLVNQEAELYGAGSEHTADLQNEVNRFVMLEEPEPDDVADARRDQLLVVFERALATLDREGFFGQGEDRHAMTLAVEIVDADEEEWNFMTDVMKRLNPPESIARFMELAAEDED